VPSPASVCRGPCSRIGPEARLSEARQSSKSRNASGVQGKSGKRRDLDADGRYAFHTYVIPDAPSEFLVRGRAVEMPDAEVRATAAKDPFFTVQDSYPLYELMLEHVLLGERPTADDWPPLYTSWSASK